MSLGKTVFTLLTIAALSPPGMAAAVAGKTAETIPAARAFLLAQDRQPFELEDFQFWADQCLLLAQEDDRQKTLESCEQAIALQPNEPNLDLWTARGVALFELRAYPEAIASFNQVLSRLPEDSKDSLALAYQCAAYVQLNRLDEAVDTCEIALLEDGNWGTQSPGFAWYQRGLALHKMGRLETALDSFTRAVDNQPENIVYLANQCALEIELGTAFVEDTPCHLRNTISIYEQALAIVPDDVNLWVQQGLLLEQLGDYSSALVSYEQALALMPNYSLALAHQCATLNALSDYEAAIAACEAALQGDNRWGRVGVAYGWTQHSRALVGQGDYAGALGAARRAIDLVPLPQGDPAVQPLPVPQTGESDLASVQALPESAPPSYPPAWNNLAVSLWHLDDFAQAAVAIDNTLAQYRDYVEAFGSTFQRDYPESPVFFQRGRVLAYYNQGRIATSQGEAILKHADGLSSLPAFQLNQVIAYFEAAIAAYDNAAIAYDQQAALITNNGRFPSNEQRADQELLSSILVQKATTSLYLADAYRAALQSEPASDALWDGYLALQSAVVVTPDSFSVHYSRGLIALQLGLYPEALRAFETAAVSQPENIYVQTGQGLALTGLGQTEAALATLEQVVNQLPGYVPAETARQCIVERIGQDVRDRTTAAATPASETAAAPAAGADISSCARL